MTAYIEDFNPLIACALSIIKDDTPMVGKRVVSSVFVHRLNHEVLSRMPTGANNLLSRHSLSSVQLASMAHCYYASAPVVVHYSGNKLATTCGTTPYLGVS